MYFAAMLSVMFAALALAPSASACSCSNPIPQGSEFLHLGEGDRISLPANALGVLFQRRLDLDVIDSDRQGNEILGTLPQRLDPEQFMIEDLTAKRRLKAVLTPLNLDAQLGNPRSYFLRKEGGGKDRDVSAEVRLAKGLFRVSPAGGFVEGHTYSFVIFEPRSIGGMANVIVGPPLPRTRGDNRIALVPQGTPSGETLTMASGGMCSAERARIVQRLSYAVPEQRRAYRHLLMAFTSQQFFGRELAEFDIAPGAFVQTAYSSHMCGSGRSSLGRSELGEGKDLVSIECPEFGVKPERRLVRGHVGMLELDDALQTTPVLEVAFARSSVFACMLLRVRAALTP